MNQVMFYITAFDALAIMALGVIAAVVQILGLEMKKFWERILPATLTIVGTSLAAGIVLWVGSFLFLQDKL